LHQEQGVDVQEGDIHEASGWLGHWWLIQIQASQTKQATWLRLSFLHHAY